MKNAFSNIVNCRSFTSAKDFSLLDNIIFEFESKVVNTGNNSMYSKFLKQPIIKSLSHKILTFFHHYLGIFNNFYDNLNMSQK